MPPIVGAQRGDGRAQRRRRITVRVLQPQHVRAHLRLVERGRIAAVARGELADAPQILGPRRRRERPQPQRLDEPLHRLRVGRDTWLNATPKGGRMHGLSTGGFG
jgi:hypothetical protein